MKKIFICYRTVDEPYAATLIDQVLVPHFGSDVVFRASRSIALGDDYEEKIFEAIRAATVFLVVIGPQWIDARDENGRRLDDPDDLVRREIRAAFEYGVRVVPVLMNTRRLLPGELPDEISQLTRCQDVRINFRNSEYDLPALVERLKRVMAAPRPAERVPVTRSLLVVDAEHSGPEVVERRRVLHTIVEEALASTGVTPDRIFTESRGDRVVVVVDAGLLNLLDTGVETLVTALSRHNVAVRARDRLRLRIAVCRGQVHRDDHGWSGEGLTEAFGMLTASQVTAVLARADRAQCILAVSDSVYDELVVHGYGNLNANAYARLDEVGAWVRVPGYPIPPVTAERGTDTAPSAAAVPSAPPLPEGTRIGNLFQGNAIQHVNASIRDETAQ